MGCDIHFFVERYSTDNFEGPKDVSEERNLKLESVLENGSEPRWIPADKWEYVDEYGEGMIWNQSTEFYGNRNYYLFTVLAGVRGDSPTITEPRGI